MSVNGAGKLKPADHCNVHRSFAAGCAACANARRHFRDPARDRDRGTPSTGVARRRDEDNGLSYSPPPVDFSTPSVDTSLSSTPDLNGGGGSFDGGGASGSFDS